MPLDVFPDTGDAAAFINAQPGFGPGLDPSFGEGFGAAWHAAAGTIRDLRVGANASSHVQDWLHRFEKVTGYAPPNPQSYAQPGDRAVAFAELHKAYRTELSRRPDLDLPAPPTESEARAFAIDLERGREADAAGVVSRPGGIGSKIGFALGGIAAATVDPINLASMAVGAPAAAGILKTALTVGAIGGVSQAGISAVSFGVNREINPDYGVSDALTEVGLTAGGGRVVSTAVALLSSGWSR